ncbi:hypothetical protein HDU87_007710 [Geranomyces variabilis]|uniref:Alcohol dehydrogenase iron-type/glycerol dehydrogenase GldA domain-containing protein n=1 Tax=Geranomyces variabilis TaxID=109894 RepID=A0AAD5TEH9_9FUNG|nr:hypothetical protein HDU87_007710 [Geranomyces variabilis]
MASYAASLPSQLAGLYEPNKLQALRYGANVVRDHLLAALPTPTSRAFIVTGTSLATRTPLIKDLEQLLVGGGGDADPQSTQKNRHAGTFAHIKQHAPVEQLDEATRLILRDENIDTIISVGGGSPIDSAKAIIFRVHEQKKTRDRPTSWLRHIAIPTTLSAAECTPNAGYTQRDGTKTGIKHPNCIPAYVFYDPSYVALHTPPHLILSTGIRALDHAVEAQYHPTATYVPCQLIARSAIAELFALLPQFKADPTDQLVITRLFLAAYASLGFLGANTGSQGLGLSHSLGYALGSPYGIPHGVTSCLTLGHVVKMKALTTTATAAAQIAALLPFVTTKQENGGGGGGGGRDDDDMVRDAQAVGDAIIDLVKRLGLATTLTEQKVGKDQVDIIVERATKGLSDNEKADELYLFDTQQH